MTDPARKTLATLLVVSIVGLLLWIPALGYTLEWNHSTLPLSLLFFVALNGLLIQFVSRQDSLLRSLLWVAFVYRLTMCAAFLIVLCGYYGGGDALLYHREGVMHAQQLWTFGEPPAIFSYTGTQLVSRLTGVVYAVLGPSLAAGMLAFSMLAFWGSYFFLRMYRATFPRRDLFSASLLLFFLPSLVFWTSSIGKDAVTFFSIALFVYSLSQLSRGFRASQLALLVIGLLGAARVRPHIALMLALAATASLVLATRVPLLTRRVSLVLGVAILVIGTLALLPVVQQQLRLEDLSLASTREFLDWQVRVTTRGGSAIAASGSLLVRLAMSPLTLVRPFPWEAHNLTAAMASAEGLLIAFFLSRFWRNVITSLRAAASELTIVFSLLFSAEFLFAFSSVANFGILARQRVMLLPLLICFFVAARTRASTSTRRPAHVSRPLPQAKWKWSRDGLAG